jgi:hypothetical protein
MGRRVNNRVEKHANPGDSAACILPPVIEREVIKPLTIKRTDTPHGKVRS